jgi:hypothetical protein
MTNYLYTYMEKSVLIVSCILFVIIALVSNLISLQVVNCLGKTSNKHLRPIRILILIICMLIFTSLLSELYLSTLLVNRQH